MKIMIRADHPIFKRIDKVVEDYELAEIYGELFEAGYENIRIEEKKADDKKNQ